MIAVPEMGVQSVVVDLERLLGRGAWLVADGDARGATAMVAAVVVALDAEPFSLPASAPSFRLAADPWQASQRRSEQPGKGAATSRRMAQDTDDCVESLRVHGVLHCVCNGPSYERGSIISI
jgi:hypothetical protein